MLRLLIFSYPGRLLLGAYGRCLLLPALILGLCCSPVFAAEAENVEKVLYTLGFSVLLQEVPETLLNAINQRRKETGVLNAALHQRLKKKVNQLYAADGLLADMSASLAQKVSEQELGTLQNLLATEQAQKLFKLRAQASTDEGLEKIRQMARSHEDKPLGKNRLTLLDSLDNATADTEFFIAAQVLSIYTIKRVFDTLQKKPQDKPEAENALMNMFYQQLHRPSKFTTTMTYRYAFRDVADQELMEFIQIYRFVTLQAFLRVAMEALQQQMQNRMDKLVGDMEKF